MSLVTVHGPNTMYTSGAGVPKKDPTGTVQLTQSQTNGLVFSFGLAGTTSRPTTDFTWSFTGPGSPASQNVVSGTVTFTGPGAITATCVVAGVGTPPPANGTYGPISGTAVSGAPREVPEGEEAGAQAVEPDMETAAVEAAPLEFDPYDYTVAEVIAWVDENPDEAQAVLDAEQQGKNRSTLVAHLEAMLAN